MPSDATEAALGLLGLTGAFIPAPSSTTTTTVPAKRKQPPSDGPEAASSSSESISCICGYSYDDGFSIGCDSCSRWCHAACFNIVDNEVPDEWQCWVCAPRPVDRDRAVKLQKAKHKPALAAPNKRRNSPGVERRARKPSAVVGHDGGPHKRKRRASINATAPHANPEDEHVDIDEPWSLSYVPITKDIVPVDDTRDRLRRVASDWRGVSAISPSPPSHTPGSTTPALLTPDGLTPASHIAIHPVSTNAAAFPSYFANGNASVRPPSYAVHASEPIPSSKFIAPYPSTIIPTATYLSDPLNAYAHLGMPKPYVHLFGPPLDVALDARITGDRSRFVRSGCRPNAILRPMFCPSQSSKGADDNAIKFGIFALRDLKANEEVVLGWEWDDDNVVHHLPALIESPFSFPPHQIQHLRAQMTSMLHTLASTFTTCACGARARDCVLTRLTEFVENQTPLTPSPSPPSQFVKEKHGEKDRGHSDQAVDGLVDLGPLIGIERGFRTRERIPHSGGMGGVELVPSEAGPSRLPNAARKVSFPDDLLVHTAKMKGRDRKGKSRAVEGEDHEDQLTASSRRRRHSEGSREPMNVDSPSESRLPPKLRKAWIAKNAERLRERHGESDVDMSPGLHEGVKDESYFDSRDMPPPPVPHTRTPPLLSAQHLPPPISATSSSSSTASSSSKPRLALDGQASPSIPFSKLSLLSPLVTLPPSARPDSKSPPTPSSTTTTKPKSVARKPRRPPASPHPLSESEKPAKTTKAKVKAKAKTKEKPSAKGKKRAASSTASPRSPATPLLAVPPSPSPQLSTSALKSPEPEPEPAAESVPEAMDVDVEGPPPHASPKPASSPTDGRPPTPPRSSSPLPALEQDVSPSTPSPAPAPAAELPVPAEQASEPICAPEPARDEPVREVVMGEPAAASDAHQPVIDPTPSVAVLENVQPAPVLAPVSDPEQPAAVPLSEPEQPAPAPASALEPAHTAPDSATEPEHATEAAPAAAPEPQPEPEPEPEPEPAPTKVKLSLKDFAARKKKQRAEEAERAKEEQERASSTAAGSPCTPVCRALPELEKEGEDAGGVMKPKEEDGDGDVKMEEAPPPRESPERARALSEVSDRHPNEPVPPQVDVAAPPPREPSPRPPTTSPRRPRTPQKVAYLRTVDPDLYTRYKTKTASADPSAAPSAAAPVDPIPIPNPNIIHRRSPSRTPTPPASPERRRRYDPRDPSPTSPKNTPFALAPSQSHEDGEIFSPPPPPPPPLVAPKVPPTAPRAHGLGRTVLGNGNVSPPPPALAPPSSSAVGGAGAGVWRQGAYRIVPTGPRRRVDGNENAGIGIGLGQGLALGGGRAYGGPPPPPPPPQPVAPPFYAPRAPSVDRERERVRRGSEWDRAEREREREREWVMRTRPWPPR